MLLVIRTVYREVPTATCMLIDLKILRNGTLSVKRRIVRVILPSLSVTRLSGHVDMVTRSKDGIIVPWQDYRRMV